MFYRIYTALKSDRTIQFAFGGAFGLGLGVGFIVGIVI